MTPLRIVSGGQTGVDRAALDVSLELGIPCGGWCPLGRRAEDGAIPPRYPLRETPSEDYPQRTDWNVCDADATLILVEGEPSGGTQLTIDLAEAHGKPHLVVDLTDADAGLVRRWLDRHRVGTLNIAGPRESLRPGISARAAAFLRQVLQENSDD
jgi:hypothetical protein